MALVRSDPFREVDRLFQQIWGAQGSSRSMAMPMDAYRKGDSFLIRLDLPGVEADRIELTVEDDILTIKAERLAPSNADGVEQTISERSFGTFIRQVLLGTKLQTDQIQADYESGVLTIVIPVAEQAKPRRIEVQSHSDQKVLTTV